MKALFYKDITMALRYYWFAIIFTVCGFIMALLGQPFSVGLMSCLFIGMLGISNYTIDEKNRWTSYSAAFPYTGAQIVSEKYILSLAVGAANSLLLTLGTVLNVYVMKDNGNLTKQSAEYIPLYLMIYLAVHLIWGAVMPVMFRYGSEKARWFLCIMGGIAGGCTAILLDFSAEQVADILASIKTIAAVAFGVVALLFIGGWLLSIKWYRKREM